MLHQLAGTCMFALNFYPELYADALMRGRKGATIRLGDKSDKYRSGQIVWITVGRRYQVRQKLFTAVIDDVTVKNVGELTQREVEKENLEFRSPEDVMTLLSRIYDRVVTPLDVVTIISFSPVREDGKDGLEEIYERWV
ncbi:MAG: ASCH domain-containing protein [Armatimonadota bacterium]